MDNFLILKYRALAIVIDSDDEIAAVKTIEVMITEEEIQPGQQKTGKKEEQNSRILMPSLHYK